MTNAAVDAGTSRGPTGLVNGKKLVAGWWRRGVQRSERASATNLAELVGPRRSG